jgi:ComF family protein
MSLIFFLVEIDLLVPVPLHPKKEHQRGFNQSLLLCKGMNSVLNIDLSIHNLIRNRYTETQTKKNKNQRIENIKNAFEIQNPQKFMNKNVLLIDDVITTGSTLRECIKVLSKMKGIKIKVLLLAKATN